MQRLLLLLCLVFSFSHAHSQILGRFYYNKYWELTKKDSSTYFRSCVFDTTKLQFAGEVRDFTSKGKLVMQGRYQFGMKNGMFTHYYPSGQIESQGEFSDNRRIGTWKYFYENGNLQQEVEFRDNDFFIISFFDVDGKKLLENGTGDWKYTYEEYHAVGKIIIEGHFQGGKKDGEWLCYFDNGNKIYSEKFKDGELKKGILYPIDSKDEKPKLYEAVDFNNKLLPHYKYNITEKFSAEPFVTQKDYPFLKFLRKHYELNDTTGEDVVFMLVEQMPEVTGGLERLMQILQKNMKYPIAARNKGIQGSVFVSFVVERDGTLSDINVIKGIGGGCDEEAVRVVKLTDSWMPGMQNGKVVRCRFVLPVKFKME